MMITSFKNNSRYRRLYQWLLVGCFFWICSLPMLAQDSAESESEKFECLTTEDAFVRHIEQGAFYRGRRQFAEAYQEYNCAVHINPLSVLGYRGRGVSLLEQGLFEDALVDLTTAIEMTPQDAYLFNSRGWTYYQLGETDSALRNFDRAIALDSKYAIAFNNRGLVYRSMGELEKALRDFQTAIDIQYPERRYVPYMNMADTYYVELKSIQTAINWYEEAAKIDPNQGFIYKRLGDVYLETGSWQEASKNYERFLFLQSLNQPEILDHIRWLAIREFIQRYSPLFVIFAIGIYFLVRWVYQQWRKNLMQNNANPV